MCQYCGFKDNGMPEDHDEEVALWNRQAELEERQIILELKEDLRTGKINAYQYAESMGF